MIRNAEDSSSLLLDVTPGLRLVSLVLLFSAEQSKNKFFLNLWDTFRLRVQQLEGAWVTSNRPGKGHLCSLVLIEGTDRRPGPQL